MHCHKSTEVSQDSAGVFPSKWLSPLSGVKRCADTGEKRIRRMRRIATDGIRLTLFVSFVRSCSRKERQERTKETKGWH